MKVKFGNTRRMLSLAIAVAAATQNSTSSLASVEPSEDVVSAPKSVMVLPRRAASAHCSMSKSLRRMRVARGFRRRR